MGFGNSDRRVSVDAPAHAHLESDEAQTRFRILNVTGGLVLWVLMDEMNVENVLVHEGLGGPSAARR